MSDIRVIKNFISYSDLKIMNKWTLDNYEKEFFNIAPMHPDMNRKVPTRFTTRRCIEKGTDHLFDYPSLCYEIQNRIKERFKLDRIAPIGKNGIANGIGMEEDMIVSHSDPQWIEETFTVHFNVISQKPLSGGVTIIENKPYDIDEGDLLIYNVQNLKHRVNKVIGDIPRIIWVFGFCVTSKQLSSIFNIFNIKRLLNA